MTPGRTTVIGDAIRLRSGSWAATRAVCWSAEIARSVPLAESLENDP